VILILGQMVYDHIPPAYEVVEFNICQGTAISCDEVVVLHTNGTVTVNREALERLAKSNPLPVSPSDFDETGAYVALVRALINPGLVRFTDGVP